MTTRKQRKDFSNINTGRVYSTIAQATADTEEAQDLQEMEEVQPAEDTQEAAPTQKPRKTYTAEEAAQIMETLDTTGRKGCKLPRINLAFTPSNYDYVKCMARVSGQDMTHFVNKIIADHLEEHRDIYKKALEFRNMF